MADDWVQRRYEASQEKFAAEARRERWERNAQASYDAFFDQLRSRVESDVAAYNLLYGARTGCRARFQNGGHTFTVILDSGLMLTAKKSDATVIALAYKVSAEFATAEVIEVSPNENGVICLKKGPKFFSDVSEASEAILSGMLCA